MACTLTFTLSGVKYSIPAEGKLADYDGRNLSDILGALDYVTQANLLNNILKYSNVQAYKYEENPTVSALIAENNIPNINNKTLTEKLEDLVLPEGSEHFKLRAVVLGLLGRAPNKISLVSSKIKQGSRQGHGVYIDEIGSIFIHAEPNDKIDTLEDHFLGSNSKVLLERLAHELTHNTWDNFVESHPTLAGEIMAEFNTQKAGLPASLKSIISSITKAGDGDKLHKETLQAKEVFAYYFSNFEFQGAYKSKIAQDYFDKLGVSMPLESIASLSTSISTAETPENPAPFIADTKEALQKMIAEVDPDSKDYQADRAKQVLDRFRANTSDIQASKEFKYQKFDVSYGEAITVDDYNRDIQILRLTENDLVLVSKDLFLNPKTKEWEMREVTKADEKEAERVEKTSYRSVISTYINANNEVMINLPVKDGSGKTYSLPAKYVKSLRKYAGDLIDLPYNKELAQEYSDWLKVNVNSAYGDTPSPNSIIRTIDLVDEKSNKSFQISVASNYESYGFKFYNAEAAKGIYEGAEVGDVVKVHIPAKKGESAGGYRGRILRKFGNSIEVVSAKGGIAIVKLSSINEIIYLKENHQDFLSQIQSIDKGTISQDLIDDGQSQFRKYRKINFVAQNKKETEWKDKINDYFDIYSKEDTDLKVQRRRNEVKNLKSGDLVKIKWFFKDEVTKQEKETTHWYPVVAKTSDTIYYYNSTSEKVSTVNILDGKNYEIYGLAINNTGSAKLFDEFNDLRKKFEGMRRDDDGKLLSDDTIKNNLGEALRNAESTGLQDVYNITEIEDTGEVEPGEDNDLKLAASQLQRGSIVKAHVFDIDADGKDKKTKIYKWFVVTSFDENTGRPIGITQTKDKNGKTGVYKEYPIEFQDIKAIGHRLTDNIVLNISGNKTLKEYTDRLRKTFDTISDPIFITKDQIPRYERPNRTFNTALYGLLKNGKMGYAVSEKYIIESFKDMDAFKTWKDNTPEAKTLVWGYTGPKLYILRGKQYMKKLYTNYLEVHDLLNYAPNIHDNIKIGDIVTETWQYQGDNIRMDALIVGKTPTGLWVERIGKSPSGGEAVYVKKKIYRHADGVEYPQISDVYLHKKHDVTTTSKEDAKTRQTTLLEGNDKFQEKKKSLEEELKEKPTINKNIKASLETDNFYKSRDSESKIMEIIERLQTIYNVPIVMLRTDEINTNFSEILGDNVSKVRGFIHEGNIYINLDKASSAEPLHEMAHIILESIKANDYDLYQTIINSVKTHPYYDKIAENYPGRTPDDLDEEVFVTVFGEKYRGEKLNDYNKVWYNENENIFTNIWNHMKNLFASIFDNKSILNIPNEQLAMMSLDELMTTFGDNLMEGKFTHVLNFETSTVQRKVTNLKSDLLSNSDESENYLRKTCNN